jgi:hypothetical protein
MAHQVFWPLVNKHLLSVIQSYTNLGIVMKRLFLHVTEVSNHSLKIFSFIVVLGGDTLWHLQRFLQCIKCIILEFTPSTTPLHRSSQSLNSYNRYLHCSRMHVYRFFALYSSLYPLFPPPHSRWCQDLLCPSVWFLYRRVGLQLNDPSC